MIPNLSQLDNDHYLIIIEEIQNWIDLSSAQNLVCGNIVFLHVI